MRLRLLLAAAALLGASPALAAQAVATSVEDLARASDAVVRGRVSNSLAERSKDGLRIFTTYEVRTREVLRGKAPAAALVVVPGGIVGDVGQRVDAAPSLSPGEEVIVFLQRSADGTFAVTGLAQGKFSVLGALARPDVSQLVFVGTSVDPGERRVEEMTIAELEHRVRSIR